MADKYDFLVIGSGPAGHVAAIKAAQLGLKVAVVEKDQAMFGGVCLNEGCIPAKSLFRSADIYNIVRNSKELCGTDVKCGVPDLANFVKKSRETAEQLKKGLAFLFKKNGIKIISGEARFLDESTVEITGKDGKAQEVKADKFLVATGSVPKALPGMDFDGKSVITSSDAIRLKKVPKSILVVGGGYIGAEFASYFNLVGSDVTVVEMMDSLIPTEDMDISRRMQAAFREKGIKVLTSSKVFEVGRQRKGLSVTIKSSDRKTREKYDVMLVSVGRQPCTSGIGLENIGVKVDEKGFIRVDEAMRTSVKNVYAAGDVVKGPMLAHAGYAEGERAAEGAAGHDAEPLDYACVPSAVYTEIQAASVGITEQKAKEDSLDYSTGKYFFKANGKAVVNSQTEGFIKIIADKGTRKFLGVHIIGHEAADLIHEFVVAKKAGLTVDDVAGTVHAHPTLSETAADACKSVFGKPIHG